MALAVVLAALACMHAAAWGPSTRPVHRATLPRRATATDRVGDDRVVALDEVLSTCIDACERGCAEVRRVHAARAARGDGDGDGGDGGAGLGVAYKIADDPRSALTAADLASQAAIVGALRRAWGGALAIVGEEDAASPDMAELCDAATASLMAAAAAAAAEDDDDAAAAPSRCPELARAALVAPLSELTVFVDPLDGTREFVEGRVRNVQVITAVCHGVVVAGASREREVRRRSRVLNVQRSRW